MIIKLRNTLLILFFCLPVFAEEIVSTGVSDIYLTVEKVTYETENVTIILEANKDDWQLEYVRFLFEGNIKFEVREPLQGVFEPILQGVEIKQITGEEFLVRVRIPFVFYEPVESNEAKWKDQSLLLDIYATRNGPKKIIVLNEHSKNLVKEIK